MQISMLFIGDIVGKYGRKAFKALIEQTKASVGADFVVVNGENAADGFGITPKIYREIEKYADVITMGNHTWDRDDILPEIDNMVKLIRPINFCCNVPGVGFKVVDIKGAKVLVANAIGRIFMNPSENPFFRLKMLAEEFNDIKIKIVDFHAEATSEKEALGWYLDGVYSAVIGTHTHVQTADERILPKGCAYISDAGMTGCHDGVLGFSYEEPVERFLTGLNNRLKVCKTNLKMQGVVVRFDVQTGKATEIFRVSVDFNDQN